MSGTEHVSVPRAALSLLIAPAYFCDSRSPFRCRSMDPRFALRSRSTEFYDPRSLLRSAQVDFRPVPLRFPPRSHALVLYVVMQSRKIRSSLVYLTASFVRTLRDASTRCWNVTAFTTALIAQTNIQTKDIVVVCITTHHSVEYGSVGHGLNGSTDLDRSHGSWVSVCD